MAKEKVGLHDGHRQRLKNKFLENGFQGFEPHNILELLLFYSIPRKDTNEIAHKLINHFGSLKDVFDASFDELIQIDGIKESSATLIKMVPQIASRYASDSLRETTVYDTANKIGEYFVNKYFGEQREIVYVMLLNNKFELLTVAKIHEGSVNSTYVSARKILDLVVKHNASMVVLVHNHPNGTVCPSNDDIETTANLMAAFNAFDIRLIEHFVVAGNEFCPIIHNTGSLQVENSSQKPAFKGKIDLKF